MATLADSLVSSSARRLPVRKRPDLSARRHVYQGRAYWVVKEPVGLNYFRFQEEEFSILNMLDGTQSLDSLKDAFEEEFPPQKITVEELAQFLGMLHKSGLIITDAPGQGAQLKKRRDERKRKELLGSLANILALRFKGIDPERILNFLHPFVSWMFRPWAVAMCMTLAISALLLVLVEFDVFRSKLPAFHDFFAVQNWWKMAIVLGITKVIHEFGHGLSCKHYGGECHEMGVMLLVLTPCLYCNVSDSWMLPNKWHRAIIGAAGMYIEICIASICTFIWWFSEPGLLNYLALSTMFVCSVSTVVFNANPLLRYDGYYILSDLMEIPNLRQKASTILQRKLAWWCLGIEPQEDPFLPQRNQAAFALFTVASFLYRWVVLFSILMFLYRVFEPYGLKVIGQMIALASIGSLVVQPLYQAGKFFFVPGRIQKVKKARMYATLGILTAVVAGVLFIPLPHHVICPVWLTPRGAEPIYVSEPGLLTRVMVQPNEEVAPDTVLAQLENHELSQKLLELASKRDETKALLESLRSSQFTDDAAAHQIESTAEALTSYEEQVAALVARFKSLTLKCATAGKIMPPESVPARPVPGRLASWSGSPFEERNQGALLERGTMLCWVGDPQKLDASIAIDQSSFDFVRDGQEVEIMLDELPGHRFHTKIASRAREPMQSVPRQLSDKVGGTLLTQQDTTTGQERPLNTTYQALAPLDNPDDRFQIGMKGIAKIHTPDRTLWDRLYRFASETFSFKL